MAVTDTGPHENWSSRLAFILAAVGSAVGLGNIWKFPYEAGAGGGGAFVIIYLLFVFAIGVPVMIAELTLGRRGHLSPPNAVKKVAAEEGRNPGWAVVGWIGVIGAFLVLSFYSVIAGLTLSYMFDGFWGDFTTLSPGEPAQYKLTPTERAGQLYDDKTGLALIVILWHAVFIAITISVVALGIRRGLEKAVTFLMPVLFLLLVMLVIYSLSVGDAGAAFNFLFKPDFSALTLDTVLQALGQAFFSLSLALGAIMTYGAYVPKDVSLPRSALIIAAADTVVALLAGLAIFPLVFQYGLSPDQSIGLIFITLPIAFAQMPLGALIGGSFFLLLSIAALTSAISLLEPLVSWLEEHRGISRVKSTVWAGAGIFVLGIGSALSLNAWSGVTFWQGTFFDNLDFLTNNIMMPLGGLLIAVFVGWMMRSQTLRDEIADIGDRAYGLLRRLLTLLCPVALLAIFFAVSGAERYVLLLLELAGYGIAEQPGLRLAHATVVTIVVFVPTLLAAHRKHPQTGLLFFTNAVAGWTPVGWIFCLFWAHRPSLLLGEDTAPPKQDN